MNPVFAVKDDFACRDKSKVIAYCVIFGLSKFLYEEKIKGSNCQ